MPQKETLISNSGLCIKETGEYGKGVFAEMDFTSEECVLEVQGVVRDWDDIESGSREEDTAIQIGPRKYLVPHVFYIGAFVNHSCDPNCGIQLVNDRVFFVSIRDIRAGEEITFDYSTTMDSENWKMNCLCGSPQCRGLITDFKCLPKSVQEKYIQMGVIPEFILKGIENLL